MDSAAYQAPLLGNYAAPTLAFERGQGTRITDVEGRDYLDFSSGIAVTCLGHSHPKWIARVREQTAKLVHCSNLFAIPEQARLAERLIGKTGPGRMFFCNSGTEANEALVKLARLHGRRKADGEEGRIVKIVSAEGVFHGRTYGAMSATHGEKIRNGFAPLCPGFTFAKFNDLNSFAAAIDDETAAVLIEPIQGENGIRETSDDFLRGLRELCDERDVLLMLDEVQAGMGRTGTFFAYERSGIWPDAIALAKGLGGGFPIGATWTREAHASLFTPGSHGSTFGGNPLACAAAHAVLDVIEDEGLVASTAARGAALKVRLEKLVEKHHRHLREARGRGFLLALVTHETFPAAELVKVLLEDGLVTVPAGGNAVRLLPPLNIKDEEIDEALDLLDATLSKLP